MVRPGSANDLEIEQLKQVVGTVQAGKGNAANNFRRVMNLIAKKAGLPRLTEGTLNIQLDDHVPITAVTGVITDEEYGREEECIKLRRCRICRADTVNGGNRAVIVRPSQHEHPKRQHWKRFELMSSHHLRSALGLDDGDRVIIFFEGEREKDENWWDAPEP